MKRLSMWLVVTALLCLSENALRAEDNVPPPGFKALFNGKDLTGWKGLIDLPTRKKLTAEQLVETQKKADQKMNEHWSVKDGLLIYDGKGANLCTAEDYGDFELLLDWKIQAGGDSGIYLRGCPQVQIWDPDWADYKRHEAYRGSGALWNNSKHERWPLVRADKPVGEWNHFHIKLVGDKVTVHFNGKLVVNDTVMENIWEKGKPLPATGSIELQHHLHELQFKNIYVKKLDK